MSAMRQCRLATSHSCRSTLTPAIGRILQGRRKTWRGSLGGCLLRSLSGASESAVGSIASPWISYWGGERHTRARELLCQYAGRKLEHVPGKALDEAKTMIDEAGGLPSMPHCVGFHPVVSSISRIDPVLQQFNAHGVVVMKWFDPELASLPQGTDVVTQACGTLPPTLLFSNAVGGDDVSIQEPESLTVQYHNSDPAGVVHGVWRWSAVFRSEFTLGDFPFDFNKLPIVFWYPSVGVPGPAYGRLLLPYACSDRGFKTTVQQAETIAEWDVFVPALRWWVQHAGGNGARPAKQAFMVEMRVLRKGSFYVRMMATMCIIVSLGFTTFALEATQLSERVSILVSLLLALIAFKFTVAGTLPKICYATQFDRYMNKSILLLAGLAASATCMRDAVRWELFTVADAAAIERGAVLPVTVALWLLYHGLLTTRFFRHTRRVRRQLGMPMIPGFSEPSAFRMGRFV